MNSLASDNQLVHAARTDVALLGELAVRGHCARVAVPTVNARVAAWAGLFGYPVAASQLAALDAYEPVSKSLVFRLRSGMSRSAYLQIAQRAMAAAEG